MAFKVSVVMATFNGALYIEQQLQSIIFQLKENDEIILVDDHSTDDTIELVTRINDSRIHVFTNRFNIGVQRSFERAISLSTGDIIFLCDQDDIWHPEKVSRYTEAFVSFSDITLVLSDAKIVDKFGNVVVNSFFERRGGFVSGFLTNLIKNRYLGCVIAFRRSLVVRILPFPLSIPQHDMWIGLVNEIYGKTFFIDFPLLEYRMHDSNASLASSNRKGNLIQMIYWRFSLIKCILMRIFYI